MSLDGVTKCDACGKLHETLTQLDDGFFCEECYGVVAAKCANCGDEHLADAMQPVGLFSRLLHCADCIEDLALVEDDPETGEIDEREG